MDPIFMGPSADLSELFFAVTLGDVITYYYRGDHYAVRRLNDNRWWKIPLPPGDARTDDRLLNPMRIPLHLAARRLAAEDLCLRLAVYDQSGVRHYDTEKALTQWWPLATPTTPLDVIELIVTQASSDDALTVQPRVTKLHALSELLISLEVGDVIVLQRRGEGILVARGSRTCFIALPDEAATTKAAHDVRLILQAVVAQLLTSDRLDLCVEAFSCVRYTLLLRADSVRALRLNEDPSFVDRIDLLILTVIPAADR